MTLCSIQPNDYSNILLNSSIETFLFSKVTWAFKDVYKRQRTFSRPERMRMFFRQYLNEMEQLGVNSIGIVLLISFFIGAVITIQIDVY